MFLLDQMLVFCIKNVPLKIYFPYLVLLKNRIYIYIKWKILAWLSYDLFKFGETMTYLKKKLLHKLLAFPYLKLCSLLLHLLSDVLFSLIPGLFDLGKLHRVSCLQSLLVVLHFATSCIISNSMIKNLNSDSSVSYTNATENGFFHLSPVSLQLLLTTVFPHRCFSTIFC